ncbi:titin [Drosophila montana]|uniref:titin n=1 Tax=Drosophila montana TaxID=40370 RepID=UPI00313B1CC8
MHNLIKSRAVFEILKKPLPELLRFYRENESESECEETAGDTADAATPTPIPTAAAAAEAAAEAAKLNVNASVFVPRSKDASVEAEDVRLGELKRHFEALDVRKPAQPKLMLPWKGFPKPIPADRPSKAPSAQSKDLRVAVIGDETKSESRLKRAQPDKESSSPPASRKKPVKERSVIKSAVPDEKRREQERKVALEALKLVEQRRMRETLDQPQIIVHLTRSPVDFTPEERVRVNRLRIIKREHIESVLREMRDELELKQQKADGVQPSSRYICLQRAAKPDTQATPQPEQQQQQLQQPPPPPPASSTPKRYIPTVKQWDERCKAKANEAAAGANKENNNMAGGRTLIKLEENAPSQRGAMGPFSQGNIMHTATAVGQSKPQQQQGGAKDRELFVPRYWPPAPLVARGERRRGNLTHARNITRAFANCGLLPTPSPAWEATAKEDYEMPEGAKKSVKRYGMEELLQLEPQPHELEKPHIAEALQKLGFICE